MNINFDDGEIEEIKGRIADRLVNETVAALAPQLRAQFSMAQMKAEIRNRLIDQAAGKVAEKVNTVLKDSDVIDRALSSAERRINDRIHKALTDGIRITLRGDVA